MPEDKLFCGVGDFPMLIPYSEVCKLVEVANKLDHVEEQLRILERKYQGLHSQYVEMMQAVGEIRRML